MLSKAMLRIAFPIFGLVYLMSLCVWLPDAKADECNLYGCEDDCEFTTDFRLEDCWFKTTGSNPFFILIPGYQLVLESEDEKSEETVLCDTKWINLDGRWIKTRVVEERAFELDEDEWKTIEISRNYFAICKRTNAVYYFGEWSRDCEDGFNENDVCEGEESNEGSWEAGVDGARPGLIMSGTPLQGASYFQEIAEEDDAVDRGEIAEVGLPKLFPGVGSWSGCIKIFDTNPAEADEGGCIGENDVKFYCPGVGLVQDQELELVRYGFVGCDGDDDDFDNDRRWGWRR